MTLTGVPRSLHKVYAYQESIWIPHVNTRRETSSSYCLSMSWTRAQTSLAQHCWELVGFGNWDKLHAFQGLVWGNMCNCTVLMHARMIRSHLWKAVLLHCPSFFSLLFLLLDFTLKKNRKPYKRNNPAMEKTELTIFKIQLKPKQLRSALFCGTDCPLPAVSRIDFIQRCNVHSVPVIFSRNTRYQENLTRGHKSFVYLMYFYTLW